MATVERSSIASSLTSTEVIGDASLSAAVIDKKRKATELLASTVKKEQVTPIMSACEQLFGRAIEELTLVSGGRGTSKIMHFTVEDKKYLLRVTDEERPAFFIDTLSEVQNMKAVNDLNIAPKLHHSDGKAGVIIMEYVNNVRLTPSMLDHKTEGPKIYCDLARVLRNLHNGPAFHNMPTDIFQNLQKLVSEAEITRVPPIAREVLDAIVPLKDQLAKHMTSVPCHLDIHSNNVLFNGDRIYLIDWELSSNCDPHVDLAFAAMFFVFDKEKESAFLESYFKGSPSPEQKAKFFLMKQVTMCLYSFRLLRRLTGIGKIDFSQERQMLHALPNYRDFILENYNGCSKNFTNDDLKIFPFVFLNEVRKNLQSPEFQESIKIMSK